MIWNFIKDPEKDGNYIVLTDSVFEPIYEYSFTTEGGWNTFRDHDGELHAESSFGCSVGDEGSWIKGWVKFSDADPWRTTRPLENGKYIVNADLAENPIMFMPFTTEYGWNTLATGPENAIEDSYILGWMPIEEVEP